MTTGLRTPEAIALELLKLVSFVNYSVIAEKFFKSKLDLMQN